MVKNPFLDEIPECYIRDEDEEVIRISSVVEQWTVNPLVVSSNLPSGVPSAEGVWPLP